MSAEGDVGEEGLFSLPYSLTVRTGRAALASIFITNLASVTKSISKRALDEVYACRRLRQQCGTVGWFIYTTYREWDKTCM